MAIRHPKRMAVLSDRDTDREFRPICRELGNPDRFLEEEPEFYAHECMDPDFLSALEA